MSAKQFKSFDEIQNIEDATTLLYRFYTVIQTALSYEDDGKQNDIKKQLMHDDNGYFYYVRDLIHRATEYYDLHVNKHKKVPSADMIKAKDYAIETLHYIEQHLDNISDCFYKMVVPEGDSIEECCSNIEKASGEYYSIIASIAKRADTLYQMLPAFEDVHVKIPFSAKRCKRTYLQAINNDHKRLQSIADKGVLTNFPELIQDLCDRIISTQTHAPGELQRFKDDLKANTRISIYDKNFYLNYCRYFDSTMTPDEYAAKCIRVSKSRTDIDPILLQRVENDIYQLK